jgi:hypothetical protein
MRRDELRNVCSGSVADFASSNRFGLLSASSQASIPRDVPQPQGEAAVGPETYPAIERHGGYPLLERCVLLEFLGPVEHGGQRIT